MFRYGNTARELPHGAKDSSVMPFVIYCMRKMKQMNMVQQLNSAIEKLN